MKEWRGVIIIAGILVAGFLGMGLLIHHEMRSVGRGGPAPLEFRKLASELESKGIWDGAADAYQRYLDSAPLQKSERASVSYHLGSLYLDHLASPDKALPFLFIARNISGSEGVGAEADKRIVEALERLGRSLDAKRYLSEAAALDPSQAKKGSGGVVIAKIGDREITQRYLDDEIQALPPQLQEKARTPDGKREFLQGLIARELLLDAARREGLDNDPQVKQIAQRAHDAAIIGIYRDREIDQKIRITNADVRAYYEAHRDDFVREDDSGKTAKLSYQDAKAAARSKLLEERRRSLMDELLNRLEQAQKVEIFSDRLLAQ